MYSAGDCRGPPACATCTAFISSSAFLSSGTLKPATGERVLLGIDTMPKTRQLALIVVMPDMYLVLFHNAPSRGHNGHFDVNQNHHNSSAVKECLRRESLNLNRTET